MTKFVEIYKLNNDGSQELRVICRLVGFEVICEGDANIIETLREEGILDFSREGNQRLYFSDGIRFLEQLRFNFKSGYLGVSEIKEMD